MAEQRERPVGSLERSLAAVTIGVAKARDARKLALADTHQGHFEQTVHLELSGQADSNVGFADCDVSWQHPFLYAPQQSQLPYRYPHFTRGFEQTNQTAAPIRYDAQVLRWAVNDSDWVTGAVVRVIVDAPTIPAGAPIAYSVIAHLSFLGYATMPEGEEFLT